MPEYMTKYNAANLLERLNAEGLTVDQTLPDFVVNQQQEKELPLYLRALVGVGAFIAAFCFIGFLTVAKIIDFTHIESFVIWGLIFVTGAIGLQRLAGHTDTVRHSFVMQSSFASMAVGKVLFVSGIADMFDSGWGATLGLLIVTCATYYIYRMSIDRFLSSFAVLLSVLTNILWNRNVDVSRELLLNGFFLFQFVGTAVLLTHGRIKRDYISLAYAFAFSLCAVAVFLASHAEFGYWRDTELIHPAFINMLLTGGLIALFGWAAGGIEKLKTEPLVVATIGAVFLGLISAPGILLAIGLMVLGYAKHEKLLIVVGNLLLPIFLILYYYNLDISLLQKSGILVGSGFVLLAGRFYLKYKSWDKGDAS